MRNMWRRCAFRPSWETLEGDERREEEKEAEEEEEVEEGGG